MNEEDFNGQVPFQVVDLIKKLKDKNENANARFNYRNRLDYIRNVINNQLVEYDTEQATAPSFRKKNVR